MSGLAFTFKIFNSTNMFIIQIVLNIMWWLSVKPYYDDRYYLEVQPSKFLPHLIGFFRFYKGQYLKLSTQVPFIPSHSQQPSKSRLHTNELLAHKLCFIRFMFKKNQALFAKIWYNSWRAGLGESLAGCANVCMCLSRDSKNKRNALWSSLKEIWKYRKCLFK